MQYKHTDRDVSQQEHHKYSRILFMSKMTIRWSYPMYHVIFVFNDFEYNDNISSHITIPPSYSLFVCLFDHGIYMLYIMSTKINLKKKNFFNSKKP